MFSKKILQTGILVYRLVSGVAFGYALNAGFNLYQRDLLNPHNPDSLFRAQPDDPRKLAVITPGILRLDETIGLKLHFPGATVSPNSGNRNIDEIFDTISAHIVKHKETLKELIIDAHGFPNRLIPNEDDIQPTIEEFLTRYERLAKETGIKPTDRLVFLGCHSFGQSKGNDIDVGRYLAWAKKLNIEIAGPSTIQEGGIQQDAGFVVFKPDGSFDRDRLDIRWSVVAMVTRVLDEWRGFNDAYVETVRAKVVAETENAHRPAIRPAALELR